MKIEEEADLYQVDSVHNDSSALCHAEQKPTETDEDECSECEKLKQLVF
jgi:hypothetical protein